MINLQLTKEEARTIFAALNIYRIQHALLDITNPKDKIANDFLIKNLDELIEKLYYLIPIDKKENT